MSDQKLPELTDEEIAMFEACKSEEEWDSACDKVKKARGGKYPPDWWTKMKMTGRMDRIVNSFGGSTEMRIVGYRLPEDN